MINKTTIRLEEGYAILLAAFPILSVYGRPGIDIGTLLIYAFFVIFVFRNKKVGNLKEHLEWIILFIYMMLSALDCIIFTENLLQSQEQIIFRTIKTCAYIIILIVSVNGKFFTKELLFRSYLLLAKVATSYILIQTAMWYLFRIKLWGYLPFFLYEPEYKIRLYTEVSGLYRPTSFFYEPAHYFEYVFYAIILLLFEENAKKDKKSIYEAIYISLGVMASTSVQGIACIACIWGIWMFVMYYRGKGRYVPRVFVIMCVIIPVAVVALLCSSFGSTIIARVTTTEIGQNAVVGRMSAWTWLGGRNISHWLFGSGYGNIPQGYWSNWPFELWCIGIFGVLIIVIIYFKAYMRTRELNVKILLILHALLCMGNELFMGKYILFYFIFALSTNKSKEIFDNEVQ